MATGRTRSHKHARLDPVKIERAQKVLRRRYRDRAIDRALDLVISEYQRSRLAVEKDAIVPAITVQQLLQQDPTQSGAWPRG